MQTEYAGWSKGDKSYKPKVGERVLISPPNCDNDEGYVYDEYDVLWMNDVFILYGNENFYPNLNKLRHVAIKKLKKMKKNGK